MEWLEEDLKHRYQRRGALSPRLQVLLALRYFACGTFQEVVADTVRVHKSTVCRLIHRVAAALCRRARQVITLPTQEEANRQKRAFYTKAGFPNVIGCVDGTHICIQAPSIQEHEYVNRKGRHSINVQVLCDAQLRIVNAVVRFPGSVHDARILRESSIWNHFESQPRLDGFILGDSGYPLRDWLLTPILNPRTAAERRYETAFTSTRATVERCIGVLKRRFHGLRTEMRYAPVRATKIITACMVLHNLAIQYGTPLPADDNDEDDDDDSDPRAACAIAPTLSGKGVRQQIVRQYFDNGQCKYRNNTRHNNVNNGMTRNVLQQQRNKM